MLERTDEGGMFCNVCSNEWTLRSPAGIPGPALDDSLARRSGKRFTSLDDLVARAGLRRDEVVTLADVGALNAFGYDRRSALWQVERVVRPSGELFDETTEEYAEFAEQDVPSPPPSRAVPASAGQAQPPAFAGSPASAGKPVTDSCPLRPMTETERLVADYAGMGLTVGRHPMALRREELAMRGILRAIDLKTARQGRRVRVAGMVITRQRPGTAKGFVFLTLEDETGVANIIVRPDLYARDRLVLIEESFLIVDGVLQSQDGVTSIRAEQVQGLQGLDVTFHAHDFF